MGMEPEFRHNQPVKLTILANPDTEFSGRIAGCAGNQMSVAVGQRLPLGAGIQVDAGTWLCLGEVYACDPEGPEYMARLYLEHLIPQDPRLLIPNSSEPEDRQPAPAEPASAAALAQLLLRAVRMHALRGDPAQFQKFQTEMRNIEGDLECTPERAFELASAAGKLLESYNQQVAEFFLRQLAEFEAVVAALLRVSSSPPSSVENPRESQRWPGGPAL